MQEAADLAAVLAAAGSVLPRFHTASDEELLADLEAVEQAGRIIDAFRQRGAAEVEHRSRKHLGAGSLAIRNGARDGVELVQRITRIDHRTAKRRIGLGAETAPAVALDGSLLPGRLPIVRAALEAGVIGVESARVVVETIKHLRPRVDADVLDALVEELLREAATSDTEVLHEVAHLWTEVLDPDGAEPRHEDQRRKRSVRFGRTLSDGITRMTVILPPEQLAKYKELFASRRRGRAMIRVEAGSHEAGDDLGPE